MACIQEKSACSLVLQLSSVCNDSNGGKCIRLNKCANANDTVPHNRFQKIQAKNLSALIRLCHSDWLLFQQFPIIYTLVRCVPIECKFVRAFSLEYDHWPLCVYSNVFKCKDREFILHKFSKIHLQTNWSSATSKRVFAIIRYESANKLCKQTVFSRLIVFHNASERITYFFRCIPSVVYWRILTWNLHVYYATVYGENDLYRRLALSIE